MEKLAISGGCPVYNGPWPKWPFIAPDAYGYVQQVLTSDRWTISGPIKKDEPFERRFARAFAEYCGAKYCIPTCNGSSALLIALEALNIGFGDEVIVPALTWIAVPTAVMNANATPVFVDMDPDALQMSVEAIESAITSRTRGIIVVHNYCGLADLDKLQEIAREYDIFIIEDCSHVHGAMWKNKVVGTFGHVGVFSLQQTKVLTCGEGGVAITNNPEIAEKLELLRANGRRYSDIARFPGDIHLRETYGIHGANYCLSELGAAVLYANLKYLDDQHKVRLINAQKLESKLKEINGVNLVKVYPGVTRRVFYKFVFRVNLDAFENRSIEEICMALSYELNLPVTPVYKPININSLYNPRSKKRYHISYDYIRKLEEWKNHKFCGASEIYRTSISLPHYALLGNEKHITAIIKAIKKVKKLAYTIPEDH